MELAAVGEGGMLVSGGQPRLKQPHRMICARATCCCPIDGKAILTKVTFSPWRNPPRRVQEVFRFKGIDSSTSSVHSGQYQTSVVLHRMGPPTAGPWGCFIFAFTPFHRVRRGSNCLCRLVARFRLVRHPATHTRLRRVTAILHPAVRPTSRRYPRSPKTKPRRPVAIAVVRIPAPARSGSSTARS